MAKATAKQQESTTPAASEQETKTGTGTETEVGAETGTGTETEVGTETGIETGTEVDSEIGAETEDEADTDADQEQAKILTAKTYILYNSHQYKPGEQLPANNPDMMKAWLEAGTAAWVDFHKVSVKAIPATVLGGISGTAACSESEDGENLAGRVPKTSARSGKS